MANRSIFYNLILTIIMLSSCSKQVNINSMPQGASIISSKGYRVCETPCSLELTSEQQFSLVKNGYQREEIMVAKEISSSILPILATSIIVVPLLYAIGIESTFLEVFGVATTSYYVTDFADINITLKNR